MNIIKNISIPPTAGKRATVVVTEVKSNPALRDCIHRPPAVPQLFTRHLLGGSCHPLGGYT